MSKQRVSIEVQALLNHARSMSTYLPKIIGRAGASPPSRTAAIIFLYIFIYIYPCRTSCPKSSTCFFFSDISIFLRRKCYTRFFFSDISIFPNLYAVHGAMCAMDSSAMEGAVHSHRDFGVRRSVVH